MMIELEREREMQRTLWWLMLLAGLLSIFAHLFLLYWFYGMDLNFGKPLVDPVDPPRFHVKQVEIDPRSLEQEFIPASGRGSERSPEPLTVEADEVSAFSGPLQAPKIPLPTVQSEDVPVSLSGGEVEVPVDAFTALPLVEGGDVPQLSQALAEEASTAALAEAQKSLTEGSLAAGGGENSPAGEIPGFGEISDLVNLKPPTDLKRPVMQPILLRLSSDVLFEFDQAELRSSAEKTLLEVVQILQEAKRVRVTVEGHTDTFGGDTYNLGLSQRRAQAVAEWLRNATQLPQDALRVKGYGESRPIVSPDGSKTEQALNRRVEIRIEGEK